MAAVFPRAFIGHIQRAEHHLNHHYISLSFGLPLRKTTRVKRWFNVWPALKALPRRWASVWPAPTVSPVYRFLTADNNIIHHRSSSLRRMLTRKPAANPEIILAQDLSHKRLVSVLRDFSMITILRWTANRSRFSPNNKHR